MFLNTLFYVLLILLLFGTFVFLVHMMNTNDKLEKKVFSLISFVVCVTMFVMLISLRSGGIL